MSQREDESNHNVTFDCKYHVVFCPKYRRKVLIPPIDARLKELFQLKSEELRAEIVEMEIMPDHVHLLIKCDPQFGIHRVVK
ncbi:IS200/IS605 family transposase, partial [Paenibacillus sp. LHD-38]|uniref:IS200/IS605 family transposase n=1 Tax=Paenibacillus sp. LHD-38 TaxID=3072143 RepID=UPI00280FA8D4